MLSISGAERRHLGSVTSLSDGPLIAEDAGVAVVVGPERAADSHVLEHVAEDVHRVLDARVLRVRLDPLEGGLGPRALDLELGHEDRQLPAAFIATPTGRSVARKLKLVKYWT